jgi:hypothetical protein
MDHLPLSTPSLSEVRSSVANRKSINPANFGIGSGAASFQSLVSLQSIG